MSAPEIVHVTSENLEDVVALFDAYRVWYGQSADPAGARRFLSQRLLHNQSMIFLAQLDGVPVGFAQLYPLFSSVSMESVWLLNDLFVAADFRGQGIGKLLLQTAAEFALETGAIRVELATAKDNLAAQACYRSLGWELNEQFCHFQLPLSSLNQAG